MIKKITILVFVMSLLSSCGNSVEQDEADDSKEETTEFFSPFKLV